MTISLSDLLTLPKGANIAYKRQRWELVQHHDISGFCEPIFMSVEKEFLYEAVYLCHLICIIIEE
jgi:hypothetical protein